MRSALLLLLALLALAACTEILNVPKLKITSPAFANMSDIPSKYTCDGLNISPELDIQGLPNETMSMALIVDDYDSPVARFTHWLMWNITPSEKISEKSSAGIQGLNEFGRNAYGGPCPHSGKHRYSFRIYALDTSLKISVNSRKADLEEAMKGHILAEGELIGLYQRK